MRVTTPRGCLPWPEASCGIYTPNVCLVLSDNLNTNMAPSSGPTLRDLLSRLEDPWWLARCWFCRAHPTPAVGFIMQSGPDIGFARGRKNPRLQFQRTTDHPYPRRRLLDSGGEPAQIRYDENYEEDFRRFREAREVGRFESVEPPDDFVECDRCHRRLSITADALKRAVAGQPLRKNVWLRLLHTN